MKTDVVKISKSDFVSKLAPTCLEISQQATDALGRETICRVRLHSDKVAITLQVGGKALPKLQVADFGRGKNMTTALLDQVKAALPAYIIKAAAGERFTDVNDMLTRCTLANVR